MLIFPKVHEHIKLCNDKDVDDVEYPTTKNLHSRIMEIEGIPKWSISTTYRVLLALGFKYENILNYFSLHITFHALILHSSFIYILSFHTEINNKIAEPILQFQKV